MFAQMLMSATQRIDSFQSSSVGAINPIQTTVIIRLNVRSCCAFTFYLRSSIGSCVGHPGEVPVRRMPELSSFFGQVHSLKSSGMSVI
jgi:hypothetical protein